MAEGERERAKAGGVRASAAVASQFAAGDGVGVTFPKPARVSA